MKNKTSSYSSWHVILKQDQARNIGALLVGDISSIKDRTIYKLYKVKTVIACGKEVTQQGIKDAKVIEYPFVDNEKCMISPYFEEAYQHIKKGREEGGVLICCYSGISRSPAIAAAYLMRSRLTDYDSAIKHIRSKRQFIAPNDGFVKQLRAYQKHIQELKDLQKQERTNKIMESPPKEKDKGRMPARGAAKSIMNTLRSSEVSKEQTLVDSSKQETINNSKSQPKYDPQTLKNIYKPRDTLLHNAT